jgi:hypothetical protein
VIAGVTTYEVRNLGTGLYEHNRGGQLAQLERGESAAQVREALEANEVYGKGNVEVTGGPETYEIKFVGELTDMPVRLMEVVESHNGQEGVKVTEVAKGRPDGEIVVTAVNLGDANADPAIQPITITDKLPPGLRPVAIEGGILENLQTLAGADSLECSLGSLSCTFTGKESEFPVVPPYSLVRVLIGVNLTGASSGESNTATITGGGAPAVSVRQPLAVSAAAPLFGVSSYELRPEDQGGGFDTQAGSHPFQLTTTIAVNETIEHRPVGLVKDLHFKLPPGLIGNPTAVPRCTLAHFLNVVSGANQCLAQTVVGVARSTVSLHLPGGPARFVVNFLVPLYNLEPAVGEPARFGFLVEGVPILLDTAVRTGGDYGVTVTSRTSPRWSNSSAAK